ncbi:hypothetical protein GALMADRAFT_235821 [Galerina marginata CBS 339.88]|uniref:C3H1-type domain-containing protein n=1 Tax=Galerina marginata (strain CBS 339.88) TaxID=685588 RepID=A0A067TML5_GALM3|nr:hypothetical protein GALMADRAFT_235821 [Galerina marginata CBS 339.88]
MLYDNADNKQPPSEPQALIAQNRVGAYFEQLRGEIISILEHDSVSRETIKQLENDLGVYKRAYAGVEAERQRFEQQIQEADKKREALENQLKGHRIIALIDGDGAIFTSQLIAQGQSGGHAAAQKLSDAIMQHLTSMHGVHQYQLWVYVFLNKRGLMDTFGRVGLPAAKNRFDEFIVGFNQAAERFLMVDVGSAKEAADAKIKALLEEEIRLPQTEKIIFGGCHDNGYVTTLRSQITAGLKHKLTLLRAYTDMAAGMNELELPSFNIPDLFIPQKLSIPTPQPHINSTPVVTLVPLPTSPTPVPPQERAMTHRPSFSTIQQGFDALPFASIDIEDTTRKQISPPHTYSSAVQTPARSPKRVVTPDLDSSGSTSSSDESDDSLPSTRAASHTNSRTRRVNPNILLSKHKPPPCTLFYLSTCKHGADCKYGHDYLLQPEHYSEIRVNAKKSPCPSRNKGELCLWGDDCCYGHNCPNTTKCHFFKQNRCKFVGADMHKEPKAQSADIA